MNRRPGRTRTHVFAYGSNLDVDRMVRRVPSAEVVGATRLEGFELRFHKRGRDGTGKANAHATGSAESAVHGVVYQADEQELAVLDSHEAGYERELVTFAVTTPADPIDLDAWIYLALPEMIDDEVVPTKWYRDHVLRGARAHGFPASLISWLEEHPTEG